MPDDIQSPDNFDRLLKHLKDDSLAAQLVQAYHAPADGNPIESMKTVLKERLAQVRADVDGAKA